MAKFIFAIEVKSTIDIRNLLAAAQLPQDSPEGIARVLESAWLLELPRDVSFLAKLVTAAESTPLKYFVCEIAPGTYQHYQF